MKLEKKKKEMILLHLNDLQKENFQKRDFFFLGFGLLGLIGVSFFRHCRIYE